MSVMLATSTTQTDTRIRLDIPSERMSAARSSIVEAVKAAGVGEGLSVEVLEAIYDEYYIPGYYDGKDPVRGSMCPACVDAVCGSYNALVRTGLGSDDTFSSDVAALLGVDESEVILEGWDDAPLVSFMVPGWVCPDTALEAMRAVFDGEVESGGFSEDVAYQWGLLEMIDRVCTTCGYQA